jgi:hypothetical protein
MTLSKIFINFLVVGRLFNPTQAFEIVADSASVGSIISKNLYQIMTKVLVCVEKVDVAIFITTY